MAAESTPVTAGMRIRVTRVRPDGHVQFVKTGLVLSVHTSGTGFPFPYVEDAVTGKRACITGDEQIAADMPGWTQTTEALDAGRVR
ncbi:hypothetical protein OG292_19240 [Streptomyces sp. NBC_01511]|uniref:hypothetical protein n=1 Tax=Streptomyces sp. NBC_01511 TaxID=2903889 RepID=UPI003864C48C